eukprot:CAMPEP_0175952100 /NCGR_PEP_ID=MMETSP0108-20121206/30562_1 /TAXON_ID=195067 ORGANISM="Goniomonas pacifica, Strain CCMP1869" /NCGR_SAMPLE_ID=MMETSP0108 /ASSEMBLY_ACC=CAM_ASM_000204 /LENGTH=158 /DNA_ID=CAMNT_0017278421 /DNA_START=294 /DNA_END=770 /DNA_ORIENTATION=-
MTTHDFEAREVKCNTFDVWDGPPKLTGPHGTSLAYLPADGHSEFCAYGVDRIEQRVCGRTFQQPRQDANSNKPGSDATADFCDGLDWVSDVGRTESGKPVRKPSSQIDDLIVGYERFSGTLPSAYDTPGDACLLHSANRHLGRHIRNVVVIESHPSPK